MIFNLPRGYRYAAVYAGIRKQQQNDLALIVSDPLAQAAAVFTRSLVQAAPVRLARKHLQTSKGRVAAVLVNAGNANCATRTGNRVALLCAKAAAKALGIKTEYVLPASTGVIGVELDPKLIVSSIPALVSKLSTNRFEDLAHAMLTTDTHIKIAFEEIRLKSGSVRIAGTTKGAGMIHPQMATTLGFVMTDVGIEPKPLRKILLAAIERSYHSLSVDGDRSTNDMVVLLANGAAKVRPDRKELDLVERAVTTVMENLARQIAADGEGARKLITVHVSGFNSLEAARAVARSIANSLLVKTAIAGNDANWGRILAAAGYAGVEFNPARTDIYLQHVQVCRSGMAADYDEGELKRNLDHREVEIHLHINAGGKAEARFFTCDLTEDYVRINGSYRT